MVTLRNIALSFLIVRKKGLACGGVVTIPKNRDMSKEEAFIVAFETMQRNLRYKSVEGTFDLEFTE